MNRILATAIATLLVLPAAAQSPVRVGPLDVRNAPAEIAAGGSAAQAAARANLNLGSVATQAANSVALTGGTISGAAITLGAAGGANVSATGGSTARTLAAWMADLNNVVGNGAVGDGSTDDFATIAAGASPHMMPAGVFSIGAHSIVGLPNGRWYSPGGIGRLKTSENGVPTLQAPNFAQITAAPTDYGSSETYVFNQFNYDTSHNILAFQVRIAGASTLGAPTTGYQIVPGAIGIYGGVQIAADAGHNELNDNQGGRTGTSAVRMVVNHGGQGDAAAYSATLFANGVRAGSTDFLANPAIGLLGGKLSAGADGIYLDAMEYSLHDQGHDVAGNGMVINLDRNNGTGAIGAVWHGIKMQSAGTVAIDAGVNMIGPVGIGIDLASATLVDRSGVATYAAMAMSAGSRIYGHATNTNIAHRSSATVPGTEWLSYETATGWNLVIGSTPVLQAGSNGIVVPGLRITAPVVPATATTACTAGQVAYDTGYAYFCVATNTWKRAALASW